VSGQVFDVVDGIVLSAESSLMNSSAATAAPKKVSRMFGKAKQFWNNRNSNNNNRASGTQSNDQSDNNTNNNNSTNNEETNTVGTTVDDTDATMTTTTTTTIPTTTAGILDDGWDIIDSIINGNDGHLKHRRSLEDEEEDNCRTSMTGETAENGAEDGTLVENSSMHIPRPSSQLPIIATTTPTTTMSMTDTTNHHTREGGSDSGIPRGSSGSSGGFVVGPSLHKAKNRLWNRLRSSSSSS